MKVKTNYTGCAYITPGKEYKVFNASDAGADIYFDGIEYGETELPDFILFKDCGHLNGGDWQIIQEDEDA